MSLNPNYWVHRVLRYKSVFAIQRSASLNCNSDMASRKIRAQFWFHLCRRDPMLGLNQTIDGLFEPAVGRKKATFHRVFPYGTTESDLKKKLKLLVASYYEDCGTYELEPENLYETMRSAVTSYSINKSALIRTYKLFEEF